MADTVVYCPRCDRPYTGSTYQEAMATMQEHLEKHPDYNPDMFGDGTDDVP